jgi:hypothetical protein
MAIETVQNFGTPMSIWGMLTGLVTKRSIIIIPNAGVPSNGTSGTGVGQAGTGSLCINYTSGLLYINSGTAASPTWTAIT